jgi:hypothetical protein
MTARRRTTAKVFVPLFIGFMGLAAFFNTVTSTQFATFRAIDVVRLLASGMCFGSAVTALAIFFGGSRSN